MNPLRTIFPAVVGGAGLTALLLSAPSAHAGLCTSTTPENTCRTYNELAGPASTAVTYTFSDQNLDTNEFFQFTSNSDSISAFSIGGAPAFPPIAWTLVGPDLYRSDVFTTASNPQAPVGSPATVSFSIPNGTFADGYIYELALISNNNGLAASGILDPAIANEGVFLTRRSTRTDVPPPPVVDVPGPLPIFGAGIAFGYSRSLRRRVKAVS
jgi:hypothetical protein